VSTAFIAGGGVAPYHESEIRFVRVGLRGNDITAVSAGTDRMVAPSDSGCEQHEEPDRGQLSAERVSLEVREGEPKVVTPTRAPVCKPTLLGDVGSGCKALLPTRYDEPYRTPSASLKPQGEGISQAGWWR